MRNVKDIYVFKTWGLPYTVYRIQYALLIYNIAELSL